MPPIRPALIICVPFRRERFRQHHTDLEGRSPICGEKARIRHMHWLVHGHVSDNSFSQCVVIYRVNRRKNVFTTERVECTCLAARVKDTLDSFSLDETLTHRAAIPECVLGNRALWGFHRSAPSSQVPLPIRSLGGTDYFQVRPCADCPSRASAIAPIAAARSQHGQREPTCHTRERIDSRNATAESGSRFMIILGACKLRWQTYCLRQRESIS